jgi:hypothetical protein
LLAYYAHDPRHGKFEYLPANRAVFTAGLLHGISAAEQRLQRVTRDERKYSFIPKLLVAFTWDAAYAEARTRFAAHLERLSSTARYAGPDQADPLLCFASRGGPRLHLSQLSDTEAQAVLIAAAAALLRYERSIVFLDRPEVSAGERAIAAWAEAVREVAGGAQLIFATESPALLAAVDRYAVITLGTERG